MIRLILEKQGEAATSVKVETANGVGVPIRILLQMLEEGNNALLNAGIPSQAMPQPARTPEEEEVVTAHSEHP